MEEKQILEQVDFDEKEFYGLNENDKLKRITNKNKHKFSDKKTVSAMKEKIKKDIKD